eukprot:CAMPEP_0168407396 /NCGR_PEP_ID=MMETSP0228-20121227/26139_1 /TAXON_ID=133427 /ORGANISM="Protoceratium reticulatum, Strain CCCM 535 (=CCMP 1889)" /LENGTH=79 /DNA_ID=CAMNT_0008421061 /DNA_START=19 /DNA_END=254 /DNA_ORIENTATION=+
MVDQPETPNNEFFLARAEIVIEEHEVADFKQTLNSLETIIFFLRFIDHEDLALTYRLYRSFPQEPCVAKYLRAAEAEYG